FTGLWRFKGAPASGARYTPGAHFCKQRQPFYFNTPAVVVGKVPMKNIVFVFGHLINVLFHELLGKKMTAYIEHQPAPAKTRVIDDTHTRDFPFRRFNGRLAFHIRRKKLHQRLYSIKKSIGLIGRYDYIFSGDL